MAENLRNKTVFDEEFKDLLNRTPEIENLSNLFENISTPCVMTLTSEWGSGKTTFIKLWEKHLKQDKNIDSIYFDAWENDFVEDPFIAFMGEIDSYISSLNLEDKEDWKKVKKVSFHVVKRLSIASAKFLTFGAIDADKEVEKIASDLSGDFTQDIFNAYQTTKNEIKIFRENLEEFLQTLKKPLVIFVDELDRCKPSYTIKLLERIKHLFNVEGLIFILSIDREQLLESIRHEYGREINSEKYLRKFVDFDYSLYYPDTNLYLENTVKSNLTGHYASSLIDDLKFCEEFFNLKLRDIEKVLVRLKLVTKIIKLNEYDSIIFLFLICLREVEKKIYDNSFVNIENLEFVFKYLLSKIESLDNTYLYDLKYIFLYLNKLSPLASPTDSRKLLIQKILVPLEISEEEFNEESKKLRVKNISFFIKNIELINKLTFE